jgi:hypothetical protein
MRKYSNVSHVKEVKTLTEAEKAQLDKYLVDFKYKLAVCQENSGLLTLYKLEDSAKIINQLSKLLISRGLLDKKMETDFRYIVDSLKR